MYVSNKKSSKRRNKKSERVSGGKRPCPSTMRKAEDENEYHVPQKSNFFCLNIRIHYPRMPEEAAATTASEAPLAPTGEAGKEQEENSPLGPRPVLLGALPDELNDAVYVSEKYPLLLDPSGMSFQFLKYLAQDQSRRGKATIIFSKTKRRFKPAAGWKWMFVQARLGPGLGISSALSQRDGDGRLRCEQSEAGNRADPAQRLVAGIGRRRGGRGVGGALRGWQLLP